MFRLPRAIMVLLTSIFLAPSLVFFVIPSLVNAETLLIDDFEHGISTGWREKKFKGVTTYQTVIDGKGAVLQAQSVDSASALIYKIQIDPQKTPILRWRWKSSNVIDKGDVRKKEGDDYAARIYIVFPHWFPPNTKLMNYIWANKLPRGEFVTSTFFDRSVMIAVESGDERIGEWVEEERNIYEDFKRAFGAEPPLIGGIAIMSDTDQTGESVTGWYDDIRFSSE